MIMICLSATLHLEWYPTTSELSMLQGWSAALVQLTLVDQTLGWHILVLRSKLLVKVVGTYKETSAMSALVIQTMRIQTLIADIIELDKDSRFVSVKQ